jgi:hypothetical protein
LIGGRTTGFILDDALRQHRLVDDKLANQVDEAVDAIKVNADGLRGGRNRGHHGFLLSPLRLQSPWRRQGAQAGLRRGLAGASPAGRCCSCGFRCCGLGGTAGASSSSERSNGTGCHRLILAGCVESCKRLFIRAGGDFERSIPLGEFKDLANGVFILVGFNPDQPGEIRAFRIKLFDDGRSSCSQRT